MKKRFVEEGKIKARKDTALKMRNTMGSATPKVITVNFMNFQSQELPAKGDEKRRKAMQRTMLFLLHQYQTDIKGQTISMKQDSKIQNGAAVKVILNQAELRHVRRNTNPTDLNMISDRSNSTRFKHKTQTRQILNVIHGGEHGAIYGAFDFL